jgi:hypothetical protein
MLCAKVCCSVCWWVGRGGFSDPCRENIPAVQANLQRLKIGPGCWLFSILVARIRDPSRNFSLGF